MHLTILGLLHLIIYGVLILYYGVFLVATAISIYISVMFLLFRERFNRMFFLGLVTLVLSCAAHASVFHHEDQYTREVVAILSEDDRSIAAYQAKLEQQLKDETATDKLSVENANAAYIYATLVKWDIYVTALEVEKYRHHHSTKRDVDKKLAQLSRDIENVPPIQK